MREGVSSERRGIRGSSGWGIEGRECRDRKVEKKSRRGEVGWIW